MAMDQLEQYRQFAEAFHWGADLAELFNIVQTENGNTAGAQAALRDKDCCQRFETELHKLAEG